MTRRQRAAWSAWLSVCLCVCLFSILTLMRAPGAEAVARQPDRTPHFEIDATSALTGDLAAILAVELLTGPALQSSFLPAVMR